MKYARTAAAAFALLVGAAVPAGAEGTETLGPPSIAIAQGSGVAVAGTGMFTQPGTMTVDVPADATVEQVLLYVEAGHRDGDTSGAAPDATITVNGIALTGALVGGPTPFYGDVQTATMRHDITALGLVTPGRTTLTVDGLDTDEVTDGAGVVVIYRQPGKAAEIGVVDGNDIAFVNFEPTLDTTVPQTFRFAAADTDRTATLGLLVGSLNDPVPQVNPTHRPAALLVTAGGTTTRFDDPFADTEGPELDTRLLEVAVPAGADTLTVQMVSEWDDSGDLPASLVWVAAALAVPNEARALPAQVTAPPTVPTTAPTTTVAPAVLPANAKLPFTGGDPMLTMLIGTVALTGGAVLVLTARGTRRRPL